MCTYELIDEIKQSWLNSEYFEQIAEIDDCIQGGSTFNEVLGRTALFLYKLKKQNSFAYLNSRKAIDELLNIWAQMGGYKD